MSIKKQLSIEEEFEELSKPKKKRLNSKRKGNSAELQLSKILNDRFGEKKFSRSVMSGAYLGAGNFIRAAGLTEEQQSVFIGDIITPVNFKFVIEHKAYAEADFWDLFNASAPINEWIVQVSTDANRANKKPMLIVKYNNKKRIVYIKEKLDGYVFEFKGWYCYWLDDILKLEDGFFFD